MLFSNNNGKIISETHFSIFIVGNYNPLIMTVNNSAMKPLETD